MENKVEKWLEKRGQDIKEEWKDLTNSRISFCESPIEKLFLIEWYYQTQHWSDYENIHIISQYEIDNYRIDFMIYIATFEEWADEKLEYPKNHKDKSLIVELDSYLWHGSSPEQFTKEKERERELKKQGWNIMRFSGREIYRNVEKCIEEILEFVSDIETKKLEKEIEEYEKNKQR